jgi:cytochrome c-type biogenesis protein CcmH
MKVRILLAVLWGLAFVGVVGAAHAEPPSAKYVEGRLLAPCCYQQTLDIHESELATALRVEIDGRVARGESAAAIEEDMVARYGERVRAVPKGAEPRGAITIVGGLAVLASFLGMLGLVRRWSRRSSKVSLEPARPGASSRTKDAALDLRIDADLRALDEA